MPPLTMHSGANQTASTDFKPLKIRYLVRQIALLDFQLVPSLFHFLRINIDFAVLEIFPNQSSVHKD